MDGNIKLDGQMTYKETNTTPNIKLQELRMQYMSKGVKNTKRKFTEVSKLKDHRRMVQTRQELLVHIEKERSKFFEMKIFLVNMKS